jgi:hypothetical protein
VCIRENLNNLKIEIEPYIYKFNFTSNVFFGGKMHYALKIGNKKILFMIKNYINTYT